jgi:hypothetical protein
MYVGRTVFAKVMDWLPLRRFHTCVKPYGGNHKVRTITHMPRGDRHANGTRFGGVDRR